MASPPHSQPFTASRSAWLTAALVGSVAPALAMLLLVDIPSPAPLVLVGGPILAIGLMGAGMIGAAAAGRMWIGVVLAMLTGASLIAFARGLGMPALPHPLSLGLAVVVAGISFAARGALFARSMSNRGWWMAVFVVAGEAAIVLTAAARPGALPDWLLALLPAQWANSAIQTALTSTGTRVASSALIALGGTAAATLLVARLWPQRWPYLVMFSAWLGLSALVFYRPAPPMPRADIAIAAAPQGQIAPIATHAPDDATAAALARLQRRLERWQAASEPDLAQRARNLLLLAAVPDLYDSESLQSHLPILVDAELRSRLPADQRVAVLRAIAANPSAGSVSERKSLPGLGLPASVGGEAPVRNRMGLYAAQLARE